jgi:hypothetical protein
MKKTITKEVELCDRCENDITSTYSQITYICPVCKRTICSGCKSGVMTNYPDLCRDCVELPEVKTREKSFRTDYWKRYNDERKELEKLNNPNVNHTE